MGCVRMVLITILLMVPARGAHADIQAICASIAASNASANVTNVDEWITRYQSFHNACLAQHKITRQVGVPAKAQDEIGVKLSYEKPVGTSVNTKAVFQGGKFKPSPMPEKTSKSKISKIEKREPKLKYKKLAIPKPIKQAKVLKAKTPSKLPLPASTSTRMPKTNSRVDPDMWKKNCLSHFFGNERAPDYYISSAKTRVSCLRRPER